MSILFVLLMFLLVMSISYFRSRGEVAATQPEVWAGPPARACSASMASPFLKDIASIPDIPGC
jgi:hypothetical protein